MDIIKGKTVAAIIMVLVILGALILTTDILAWKAMIIVLILLAVFEIIDAIMGAKFLTTKQRKTAGVILGVAAIIIIGAFEVNAAIKGNIAAEDGSKENPISPSATQDTRKDDLYNLGLSYYERGDYEQAIKTLTRVKEDSDYYAEAQQTLAEAIEQYRLNLVDTANTYAISGDYKLAINILNSGLLVIPQDSELLLTIEEYKDAIRTTAIENAKQAAESEDYAKAISSIQSAIDEIGSNAELESLILKYTSDFRNNIYLHAEIALHEEGYEAAVKLIQEALNVLPNDTELLNMIEEYKTHAPVYLLEDIDYLRKDDYIYIETQPMRDNKGNEHGGHKILHGGYQTLNYENYSILFDTSGNYNNFSGTVFLPYEFRGETRSAYIFVYGDNFLLYKSEPMSMGFETDTFSIDISGVNVVKIVFQASPFSLNWEVKDVYGCLTDAYFNK